MVRGLHTEWIVECLARVADHKICAYCYFSYFSGFLQPVERQALFQTAQDCKCDENKLSGSDLADSEFREVPLKESK